MPMQRHAVAQQQSIPVKKFFGSEDTHAQFHVQHCSRCACCYTAMQSPTRYVNMVATPAALTNDET